MGEIRKNQKITVFFKDSEGTGKELSSTIKEIYNDRILINSTDEAMECADFLSEGEDIYVKIFTPLGIKAFDAVVLNSPLEDDFIVEFVENPLQIQRRQYLRMLYQTKVLIEAGRLKIVTHTLDIGGGGVRFFYEGAFEHKEEVKCHLFFDDVPFITVNGMIIKDAYSKENEHVLIFNDIKETDRDKIIKKCFDLQIELYNNAS